MARYITFGATLREKFMRLKPKILFFQQIFVVIQEESSNVFTTRFTKEGPSRMTAGGRYLVYRPWLGDV
jgi:hypothetical protein